MIAGAMRDEGLLSCLDMFFCQLGGRTIEKLACSAKAKGKREFF